MVEQTRSLGWWPSLYEPFHTLGAKIADWFSPPSEAAECGEAYMVKVELPGVKLADIDLSVHDGVITLKGEKRSEHTEQGENYYFSERQYGAFSRSFRLPSDADPGQMEADLKDGVLTITAPKTQAREEKTPIKIRSA